MMIAPKLVPLLLAFSISAGPRTGVPGGAPEPPMVGQPVAESAQPSGQEATTQRAAIHYRYRSAEVEGWTVLFEASLDAESALQAEVERLLAVKLWEVSSRLPEDVVARLQQVPLRMHLDREGCAGGVYHPSEVWLRENGYPEDWARGVEFGNARNFLSWTRNQPSMVLHELAHAWHHQVLGYDHAEIRAAYDRVKASEVLESVLYVTGGSRRAYALNNDKEFFAEMTEAWWGTNDFYPFVKVEVMDAFPELPELLEACWKMP